MSKEYTLETIHEFFDELDNCLNPSISKMMVWAGYERDRQRQVCEQKIEEFFKNPGFYHKVFIIQEDMAIVEEFGKGESLGFFTYVNRKRGYNLYPTFEYALLGAISAKYTGDENAAEWMWKMLK